MKINFKSSNIGNYRKNRTRPIQYIVIHYTANKGDTAKNNADYFAREAVKTSAHYFVDEKEIWQSVKDEDIAWHCGAKRYKHKYCRNVNSIGIEICMNDRSLNIRYESIDNAIELTKSIMSKYNIPAENVIRHFDVTGKNCPKPMINDKLLWKNFKSQLDMEEEQMKIYKYVPEMPEYAQDTFTRLVQNGYVSKNTDGSVSVMESSIQPMVYIDRLTGGKIEKLPEIIKKLDI